MKPFRTKITAVALSAILTLCLICASLTPASAAKSRFFLFRLSRCTSAPQSCRDTEDCAGDRTQSLCDLLSCCGLSAKQCEELGRLLNRCLNCRGNNTPAPTEAVTEASETISTEAPTVMPTQAPIQTPTQAPTVPHTEPTAALPASPTEETIPPTEGLPDDTFVISAEEQEVITLVNAIRQDNGLEPLRADSDLCRVARIKSQDMRERGYFSHTSPTYGSPFDMMSRFDIRYRTAGENIAMGYRTAESVVEGWMNSPGHRANILSKNYTRIGVGYIADGSYWTQLFAG